jgi:hypothetical protein
MLIVPLFWISAAQVEHSIAAACAPLPLASSVVGQIISQQQQQQQKQQQQQQHHCAHCVLGVCRQQSWGAAL